MTPSGIATDSNGNVWIANYGHGFGSVTEIPAVNPNIPIVYQGSNYQFAAPFGITADKFDNIWITNNDGASVTELVKVKN